MEDLPPQPDFDEMSQSVHTFARNFSLISNVPAFDNGRSLMQSIELVVQRLDVMTQQLARVESKIEAGNRMTSIRDLNHRVARQNSVKSEDDSIISPLYSVLSGELIQNFPRLIKDIDRLTVHEANRILQELQVTANGNIGAKRQLILLCCGITQRAVTTQLGSGEI
ncbi:hypothetical protein PT974_07827 [Cladobotryum mycophilum]|uniref:Uncharacterized protein n=1 Tax=Cladobotryum mycophilum TaxID=491253 RepID=A0ABR0SI05_9HYPO